MEKIKSEIEKFVLQKNYPCTAAIKSVRQGEYIMGLYKNFGKARYWQQIRRDLQFFLQQQRKTSSTYLTYWAVFNDEQHFSEAEFEHNLWTELSHLTSVETKDSDWGQNISDPSNPAFCLSIDGEAFFVVGLHPQSSRLSRRFYRPSLVFNSMEQFKNLQRNGEYETLKKIIRKRDTLLQGAANPMVQQYDDSWESIQFSGQQNNSTWKCPFKFLFDKQKGIHD